VPLRLPFPVKDGFNRLLGVQVTAWGPGQATLELGLRDELRNFTAFVHGGVLATLIDTACGYAGSWFDDPSRRRLPVTLTLTTNFLAGARHGPLICQARRKGGGAATFMAEASVKDGDGRLIATGQAVMRHVGAAVQAGSRA